MRRGVFILVGGLLGAAVAYCCVYLMATDTPRTLMRSDQPELAWLKHEFNLGDAEFARISQLHAGYLPRCEERCLHIEKVNTKLRDALVGSAQISPEVERLLQERAELRVTCQVEMLKHFFEISQSMPAEQGDRYLEWVIENTCLRDEVMDHHGSGNPAKSSIPAHQP